MTNRTEQARLEFYGGVPVLLVPFMVMIAGILWLGFNGMALPEAFWPMVLAGILVGLVLAKDKASFVDALVKGVASSMLATMLLAWFLAGIMGELLNASGIIQGLVWAFVSVGVTAAWFPMITFACAGLLSLSTGTSVGTLIASTPILFPVGYALGADPLLLIGAIIGGSFVGDNLAPISDTSIVSAYSQGTTVRKVVTSRFKYALVAMLMTVLAYVFFALTAPAGDVVEQVDLEQKGLIMLVVPVVLIYLMLKGHHFVTSLMTSIALGFVLALVMGLITFSQLLSLDAEAFAAGGIIIDGMNGMVGIAVFTIFLMGLIGTLDRGGFIQWLMEKSTRLATTPRRAEMTVVSVALAANALTTAGTPTMVMLGPWARRLGHKFKIAPWRRGNLLDGCSTTIIGFLPYSVAVIIPFAFASGEVTNYDGNFSPVGVVPYVFYCWALMLTIIFAAYTGWGRDFIDDEAHNTEAAELLAEDESV